MYGMVNKALRSFLLSAFGPNTWERIAAEAKLENEHFVSMQAYPDDVTYALAGAAAHVVERPLAEILEQFGRYWVPYVQREGYGEILRMAGRSVEEMLANLDGLHTRLALSFPEYRPPSFRLERRDEGELLLHYYSHRPGLAPFVIGLVHGVAESLGTCAQVSLREARQAGADHDVFGIRVRPAGATS